MPDLTVPPPVLPISYSVTSDEGASTRLGSLSVSERLEEDEGNMCLREESFDEGYTVQLSYVRAEG
jgi:hypothetical protein